MTNEKAQISLELPASKIQLSLAGKVAGYEHLLIRPLVLTDAPEITLAVEDSLPKLKKFVPWAHFPQTLDGQRKRLIDRNRDYWGAGDHAFRVFAPGGDRFLGGFGMHPRTMNPKALEIGYWVRTSMAGKGLCTEVTKALIVYGFKYLGLNRVQCGYDTKNEASAKINKKCGFIPEGILRNFAPPPAGVTSEAGWQGSGDIAFTGLCPGDIRGLKWYTDMSRRLKVFDWLGREVTTP